MKLFILISIFFTLAGCLTPPVQMQVEQVSKTAFVIYGLKTLYDYNKEQELVLVNN